MYLQYFLSWSDDGNWPEGGGATGICIYGSIHSAVFPVAGAGKL